MSELENNNNTQEQENPGTETENNTKTYTEAELQSLVDKRVTQALQTQQRKNDAKLREAERLAKMSAEEKYAYELDQREAAIAEKEKQLLLAENKNEASKILADKGLSLAFVDFVVDESADVMSQRIKTIEKAFKLSVAQEVQKRLGSNAPQDNPVDSGALTKEAFNKMGLNERQQLFKTDPETYHALSGR